MKLAHKLGAVLVAGLLAVLVAMTVSWIGTTTLRRATDRVVQTHEVVEKLDAVAEDLVDVETGSRGFAITGNESFLEPYVRGKQLMRVHLAELRAILVLRGEDLSDEQELESLVARRIVRSAEIVALRRSAGLTTAAAAISEGRGKVLTDLARARISAMQRTEQAKLEYDTGAAASRARWALVLIAVTAAVMALVFITGIAAIRRSIVHPLAALARAARRAARGGWQPVDSPRSDEIGDLQRAIAIMFKQRREAEMRTRELIDDAPVAYFLADLDGCYTDVNAAACALLGYQRSELIGKTIADLIPPEDVARLAESKRTLLEPGRIDVQEWQLRAKSGELIPVEVTTRILPEERWQAFVYDLRDRKRLDDERQRSIRAREALVAVVSHDLKNPLNAIQLRARLVERRAPDDEARAHCRSIRQSVGAMQRMISGLLDAARVEAGALRLVIENHDLGDIADEVTEILQPVADDLGVTLRCEAPHGIARPCDRDRIAQVMYNLVGNALKFTPSGGVVTLAIAHGDDASTVAVSDTGPGIEAAKLDRVFDRFYTTESQTGGTGLGLAIAKDLVEAHHGTIAVASTPGRGSTFAFTIPAH